MREWNLYVILTILIVHLIGFPIWSEHVTKIPLKEKINIDPAGSIETYINIPIPQRYELVLKFKREGHEFEHLKSLIGMWSYDKHKNVIPSGTRIPIFWEITNPNTGEILLSSETESFGSVSWSKAEVGRLVAYIQVKPGRYKLKAKITKSVPEFKKIETYLQLSYNVKNGTTWQVSYAWIGAFLNIFIFPILTILIVSILIFKQYKRLTKR